MSGSEETNYPLVWPISWPRTRYRGRSRFGYRGTGVSMTIALDELHTELARLGAGRAVISTNVKPRLDGRPYANQTKPQDPGAAVYFTLKNRRVVLACDKWVSTEENLYAIAKHIEALRGQERWGVGSVEQAFAGYTALRERSEDSCWDVLGVTPEADEVLIVEAYRALAKERHPDAGGSHDAFTALCRAKDIALATVRSRRVGA